MVETFDQTPHAPRIELRLEPPASLPRFWFSSAKGVELVQIQHDRIVLNWRAESAAADYPRYDVLRKLFGSHVRWLSQHASKRGRTLVPNLCEVTYVNAIDIPGKSKSGGHPELAKALSRVGKGRRGDFLPPPEDEQYQARWRIPGSELNAGTRPIGRLFASINPALKPPENRPIYVMQLGGRVFPQRKGVAGALEALDLAHKWVVLGFEDLTTDQMQRSWGLKQKKAS